MQNSWVFYLSNNLLLLLSLHVFHFMFQKEESQQGSAQNAVRLYLRSWSNNGCDRLHYNMLNMVMCVLQYVNLATHCWGLLNHIFWDKLSMTCPMPFYGIKQIDSSNKFHIYIEVQTSVTHSAVPCVLFFLFLYHISTSSVVSWINVSIWTTAHLLLP